MIHEIYEALFQCMQKHQYEKVCYWSAELVCSGQVKQLITFLVNLLCTDYITLNMFTYKFVLDRLLKIQTQKYNWKNTITRECICEVCMVMTKESSCKTRIYYKDADYGSFVDSLYFKKTKHYPELEDNMGHIVQHDIYVAVLYLYEMMLEGNTKDMLKVIHYIANKRVSVPQCETLDIVNNHVKSCKQDTVWILWKVLLIYCKRPPMTRQHDAFVKHAFRVFSFNYSKKDKQNRLEILLVAYMICVKNQPVHDTSTYDKNVQAAAKQCSVVYNEILINDTNQTEPKEQKEQAGKCDNTEKRQNKAANRKSNASALEDKDFEDKIKYLFVVPQLNQSSFNPRPPSTVNDTKSIQISDAFPIV